jgi:hypothetical protein
MRVTAKGEEHTRSGSGAISRPGPTPLSAGSKASALVDVLALARDEVPLVPLECK